MFAWQVNPKKRRSKGRKARKLSHRRRAHGGSPAPKKRRKSRRRSGFAGLMKHVRRGRKRNPIGMDLGNTMRDAAFGAGGALALDFVYGMLPLPAELTAGPMNYLAKGATALGLGIAADKLLKFKPARKMADGALTVVLHEAARAGIKQFAPTIDARLGEWGGSGWYHPGAFLDPGSDDLGEYLSGGDAELGEYLLEDGASMGDAGADIFGSAEEEVFG